MTDSTDISSITYPEENDQPNVSSHLQGIAEAVDDIIIPRFADATARDAAITSPADGQHAYLTSATSGGLWVYRNSYSDWQRYRFSIVRMKTAEESVNASTSFQDDNHINNIPYKANTFYRINGIFFYDGATSGDIKWEFAFTSTPADGTWGVTASIGTGGAGTANVLSSNSGSTVTGTVAFSTSDTGMEIGTVSGFFKSHASTPGTFKLRWAQNAASGTTKMLVGSYIEVTEAT